MQVYGILLEKMRLLLYMVDHVVKDVYWKMKDTEGGLMII